MKYRPILFSGPMVRAILDGRKTMTRRVIKWPKWVEPYDRDRLRYAIEQGQEGIAYFKNGRPDKIFRCPYGQPGDRLWVRETWKHGRSQALPIVYRADTPDDISSAFVWKPSIHMPRWASRITLELTGVRVERVQEISEADAKAEGVTPTAIHYDVDAEDPFLYCGDFRLLWDSINAKRPGCSWNDNPFCWVIEFKVI